MKMTNSLFSIPQRKELSNFGQKNIERYKCNPKNFFQLKELRNNTN